MRKLSLVGERLYGYRRRIATVGVAVLAVLLGYYVVFGRNGLTVFHNKQHDLRDLQNEANSLQRENAALQGHVDRLTTDPNAIEHQAREDLHYTRPGEVIVTLPNSDNGKH
jgi:cell division protein FtsB